MRWLIIIVMIIGICGCNSQVMKEEMVEQKTTVESVKSEMSATQVKPVVEIEQPKINIPVVEQPKVEVATPVVEQPKVEVATPVVEQPKVEVATPIVEQPKVEVATPIVEQPKESDTWILVSKFGTMVEDYEKKDILNLVKSKWLQNQKYQEIPANEYSSEKYIHHTIVFVQVFRQSGEYDFSIRTCKILEDASEERIPGPKGYIDHRKDFNDLLYEIKMLK